MNEGNNGSNEILGITADIQQNPPFILGDTMLCKESATQKAAGNVINFSNLQTGPDHVPIYNEQVLESEGLITTKAKPKWSRIVSMEYGPITDDSSSPLTQLGKRGLQQVIEMRIFTESQQNNTS